MKKTFAPTVFLLILCFLTACGQKQAAETEMTPSEIIEAVIDSQSNQPELAHVTAMDEEFELYLSHYYQLDREQVGDGALCYVDGVDANEIAILRLKDESDVKSTEASLSSYIERRAGDFAGYAPQQEALAENGIVVTNGNYVALLICPDTSAARTAFLNCFGEVGSAKGTSAASTSVESSAASPAPSTGKAASDLNYDSAAILWAWSSGDTSDLSETNLSIYNAAKDVIGQNIASGMSDYDKELAIHDWITGWSSFSMSAFSHAPGGDEEYSVNTPYGVLIDRSGTCWGYSSTFQLFMDMLGIECITVYGNPNSSGVEHTWNQVKLDGEWYCVDTAWDDPIGGWPGHRYFNLTSESFRNDGIHRWDESIVPEATGTQYSYGG